MDPEPRFPPEHDLTHSLLPAQIEQILCENLFKFLRFSV